MHECIKLLDVNCNITVDFANNLYAAGLHPVITLSTRVTETFATLTGSFFCDVSLLPLQSAVVRTDISDHYLIEIGSKTKLSIYPSAVRHFYTYKTKFTTKLSADWCHLYSFNVVDGAFNYFLIKLKEYVMSAFYTKQLYQ